MTQQNTNPIRKTLLSHLTLAGTAALAASSAHAQITVVDVNQSVGFAPGDLTTFTSNLPTATQFNVFASVGNPRSIYVTTSHRHGAFRSSLSAGGRRFLPAVSAGKTFNQVGTSSTSGRNIARVNTHSSHQGNGLFSDKYLPFKFTNNVTNQLNYGWLELSLTDISYQNLNADIIAYAYDTSGAKILTGDRGPSSVPEPSAATVLAAFSALTLGAVGVRRLKALQN